MINDIVLAGIVGLCCSLIFEFVFLMPRHMVKLKRASVSYAVHVFSWCLFYLFCLLLVQRPWFAVLLTLSFQLLILAVNVAKYHSLREPFILQDFEYFIDLIKHPRLYIPFFGIWNAVAGVCLFIAVVISAVWLEASLMSTSHWVEFFFSVTAMLLICAAGLFLCVRHLPDASLLPEQDIQKLGLITALWSYFRAFQEAAAPKPRAAFVAEDGMADKDKLPDIVVVQSESFFDPRLSYSQVRQDVLKQFDETLSCSLLHGQLKVPAWGANTVRTESAFLTGLSPVDFGIYQFNPYWYLSRNHLPNLISKLKSEGYKAICVHPYPVDFYMRNKVFPNLGFDQFIDISDFASEQKDGQYISDLAVAEKVAALLEEQSGPCFIFTITMENHGPLHLESTEGVDLKALYNAEPPEEARDLTVYLRHLRNADQMIESLTSALKHRGKAYLCWYGDHVPVMASVYESMGEPVADTPYFIWRNFDTPKKPVVQNMRVDQLAEVLLGYSTGSGSDSVTTATEAVLCSSANR